MECLDWLFNASQERESPTFVTSHSGPDSIIPACLEINSQIAALQGRQRDLLSQLPHHNRAISLAHRLIAEPDLSVSIPYQLPVSTDAFTRSSRLLGRRVA